MLATFLHALKFDWSNYDTEKDPSIRFKILGTDENKPIQSFLHTRVSLFN